MRLICVVGIAALSFGCGGASDSHNSSLSGGAARAGVANGDHQRPVTLTGCLQNADRPDGADATGTSGSAPSGAGATASDQMAAGRNSPGERFTLTHVANADAAGAVAASYVLEGDLEALRGHVNREVRVTGSLDLGAANTAGPQRVRVESLDQVADACRGGQSR
jgi:hypothetical protein